MVRLLAHLHLDDAEPSAPSSSKTTPIFGAARGGQQEPDVMVSLPSSRHTQPLVEDPDGVGADLGLTDDWPASVQLRELATGASSPKRHVPVSVDALTILQRNSFIPQGEMSARRVITLDPAGRFRLAFDLLVFTALLYDIVSLPVILAWDVPVDGILQIVGICCCCVWAIEIIINFFTGFYKDGDLIMEAKAVAWHYAKTWFLADVAILTATTAPFLMKSKSGSSIGFARIAKVARLLRMTGLVRILRVYGTFRAFLYRHVDDHVRALADIPGLIAILAFFNHIIACCWYALSAHSDFASGTGIRWLDSPIASADERTYADSAMLYQYTTSYHWSLCQMTPGSMAVDPKNVPERIFNIVTLLVGMVFFSSVISTLSAKLTQYTTMRQSKTKVLAELNAWLREAHISTSLASRARTQAKRNLSAVKEAELTIKALEVLTPALQSKLYYAKCRKVLAHPLLRVWEFAELPYVEAACFQHVHFRQLLDGDTLFSVGADARAMYLPSAAGVLYSSSLLPVDASVAVKSGARLAEAALWTIWSYVGTAVATSRCEVARVDVELVMQLASSFGGKVFASYGQEFWKRLVDSRCPTDLGVAHTTLLEILPFLSSHTRMLVGDAILMHDTTLRSETLNPNSSLVKELLDGSACFTLDEQLSPVRITASANLKLLRPDGKVLVHLGTKQHANSPWRGRCSLPAAVSKVNPQRTAVAIVKEGLWPLADFIDLDSGFSSIEKGFTEVHRQKSALTGMLSTLNTEHVGYIFEGKVADYKSADGLKPVAIPELIHLGRRYAFFDCLCVRQLETSEGDEDSKEISQTLSAAFEDMYGWMSEEDFEYLQNERAALRALSIQLRAGLGNLDRVQVDSSVSVCLPPEEVRSL